MPALLSLLSSAKPTTAAPSPSSFIKIIADGAAKMIKTFLYVALFFAFASCRGYRTAEGRVKPVYFTADPEIFKDTIYPPRQFWYRSLQGLQGNGIEQLELRDGDITKAFIQKPTFLRTDII